MYIYIYDMQKGHDPVICIQETQRYQKFANQKAAFGDAVMKCLCSGPVVRPAA